jgi:hypothetical protein
VLQTPGKLLKKMSGRNKDDDDNANANAPAYRSRRRPDPVPPPPQSLVTLLRKSKVALAYFGSLQENLRDDVDRWKEKARHYKALYEEQKAENKILRQAVLEAGGIDHVDNQEEEVVKPSGKKRRRKEKSNEVALPKKKAPPPPSRALDNTHSDRQGNDGPPEDIRIQKAGGGDAVDDAMFEIHSDSDDQSKEDAGCARLENKQREAENDPRKKEAHYTTAAGREDDGQAVEDSMFDVVSDGGSSGCDIVGNAKKRNGDGNNTRQPPASTEERGKQVDGESFENYASGGEEQKNGRSHGVAGLSNEDLSVNKPAPENGANSENDAAFEIFSSDDDDDDNIEKEKHCKTRKASTRRRPKLLDDSAFELRSSDHGSAEQNWGKPVSKPGNEAANGKLGFQNTRGTVRVHDSSFKIYSSDSDVGSSGDAVVSRKVWSKKIREETVQDAEFDVSSDDSAETVAHRSARQTFVPLWKQQQEFILSELIDAYRCLQHLGVSLVDRKDVKGDKDDDAGLGADLDGKGLSSDNVQRPETETCVTCNDDAESPLQETAQVDVGSEEESVSFLQNQTGAKALKQELLAMNKESAADEVVFERRSNEKVITDLLFALRRLTRVQVHFEAWPGVFDAFRLAPHWYPCGDRLPSSYQSKEYSVDHPAYVGKLCLFRALSVMDTYCGTRSLDANSDKWVEMFDCHGLEVAVESDWKQAIRIGMRERKEMVDHLLQTLFGEISEDWPVADRSLLAKHTFLRFQESKSVEESEQQVMEQSADARSGTCTSPNLEAPASIKSRSRLSSLAERRLLVQILVNMLLYRKDSHRAFQLVCHHILSCVPAIDLEDCLWEQPVMSLVVLESMLMEDRDLLSQRGVDSSDLDSSSLSYFGKILKEGYSDTSTLASILSLCVHAAARIWRHRLTSIDTRITDVARNEWACYLRLLTSQSFWLSCDLVRGQPALIDEVLDEYSKASRRLIQDLEERFMAVGVKPNSATPNRRFAASRALSLSLVVSGDFECIMTVFHRAVRPELFQAKTWSESLGELCVASFVAFRQLFVRKLDTYQRMVGSFVSPTDVGAAADSIGEVVTGCLSTLRDRLMSQFELCQSTAKEINQSVLDPTVVWHLVGALLKCCSLVSNGEMAVEAFDSLLRFDDVLAGAEKPLLSCPDVKSMMVTIETVSTVPTVRVINLKRRGDRMRLMMAQSMHAGVLVLKAVAALESNWGEDKPDAKGRATAENCDADQNLFGGHAIDGKLKLDDLSAQIFQDASKGIDYRRLIEAYVSPKWRPHDLKAFDRLANDDESALVRLSDTERACALSHICAWKGVVRTLTNLPDQQIRKSSGELAEQCSGSLIHGAQCYLIPYYALLQYCSTGKACDVFF